MNLLALDTSTDHLSLALAWNGQLLTHAAQVGQKHAELTLPTIEALLAQAGGRLADLAGIAVSIGPGSFTGLRIGCGIVQGLAFGLDCPVYGVNTLAALAAAEDATRVLSVLDARMNELYLAAFEREGEIWHEVLPSGVYPPSALPDLPGQGWTGAGNGFAVRGAELQARYGDQLDAVHADRVPLATGVLKVAEPAFRAGLAYPAERLELLYVRDKVALKVDEQARLRAK
ncbi:tRNA (adenosine(37)-N6)-threonylcarbamoyltransferase complex dimerization subunit type 1 TsaB [Chitinimonas lacunae]|uniref:tRNA (Adenosine(37)-N6)-threonylcarbamoyltransferase complex dimerization subunit type 1 TsaB n=1 Tax=Chitinimonas lacunae TaxID=1963018 RepID=A0ABV8ML18_9NEIS